MQLPSTSASDVGMCRRAGAVLQCAAAGGRGAGTTAAAALGRWRDGQLPNASVLLLLLLLLLACPDGAGHLESREVKARGNHAHVGEVAATAAAYSRLQLAAVAVAVAGSRGAAQQRCHKGSRPQATGLRWVVERCQAWGGGGPGAEV
jgi:hypothetical protein